MKLPTDACDVQGDPFIAAVHVWHGRPADGQRCRCGVVTWSEGPPMPPLRVDWPVGELRPASSGARVEVDGDGATRFYNAAGDVTAEF